MSVEEANEAVKNYIGWGVGAKGSISAYSEHGAKYEEYMKTLNYQGPKVLAETVVKLLKDNRDAKILDIAAGTGLVAEQLVLRGFRNIDGVDAASGLLQVARNKGIYGKLVCQFVGLGEEMPFENDMTDMEIVLADSYDIVAMCGAMAKNHLPSSGFADIIRVVKPGGYVVNVFGKKAMNAPWHEDGLESCLTKLEKGGRWKEISRNTFPNFIADKPGLVLIHQVL
ncbi:methyltransferase-like protein 27 [Physella acuta]|uniref:methyltransferase-like protein 27 n=1 Tax=Physella acuta TaxID=109671 RepID=UPI0027DDD217|nr:methyltransferase-like protein 27 [Physella acuta]